MLTTVTCGGELEEALMDLGCSVLGGVTGYPDGYMACMVAIQ